MLQHIDITFVFIKQNSRPIAFAFPQPIPAAKGNFRKIIRPMILNFLFIWLAYVVKYKDKGTAGFELPLKCEINTRSAGKGSV